MKNLINSVVKTYTVISEIGVGIHGEMRYLCKCSCGVEKSVSKWRLLDESVGKCKSCENKFIFENHRLYSTWRSMKTRCNNPKVNYYHRYGGRGIKVCERWESFLNFLEDMEDTFIEGFTLDRKNNDLGYFKENCRWVDKETQGSNKCSNLSLLFEGNYYTEAQLSKATGVKRTTIQRRRAAGYSVDEMVYGREGSGKLKIEYEGTIYSGKELAKLVGVDENTLRYRVRQGWNIKDIVNGR